MIYSPLCDRHDVVNLATTRLHHGPLFVGGIVFARHQRSFSKTSFVLNEFLQSPEHELDRTLVDLSSCARPHALG